MPSNAPGSREARLADALSDLDEWFQSVQIFATWVDGGVAHSATIGVGNSFATVALVDAWRDRIAIGVGADAGGGSDDEEVPHA